MSEREKLEIEKLRDLLRSVYSDSRTPADLRVKIGTALSWLPFGAMTDDLPTPDVKLPGPVADRIRRSRFRGRVRIRDGFYGINGDYWVAADGSATPVGEATEDDPPTPVVEVEPGSKVLVWCEVREVLGTEYVLQAIGADDFFYVDRGFVGCSTADDAEALWKSILGDED